jgi:hypothetical protein
MEGSKWNPKKKGFCLEPKGSAMGTAKLTPCGTIFSKNIHRGVERKEF